MSVLFVAWQDPANQYWYPVGRLVGDEDGYSFQYTKGALQSPRFVPFGRMADLHRTYRSADLFPLFQNRTLPKSRPEYLDYLRWLGFDEATPLAPMEMLSRTGGVRETDSLVVFPPPEKTVDGQYRHTFFVHGIRHLSVETIEQIGSLVPGERLFPMLDELNPHDRNAVALRTGDPARLAGYAPRFLAQDIRKLLAETCADEFRLVVERSNPDAPAQMRLLCTLIAPWPKNFEPLSGDSFDPLPSSDSEKVRVAAGG